MDDVEALAVLGLRGPVDADTVKRAYRQLARELHPDAGGDAEHFHRVRTAYEVVGGGSDARRGPAPQERNAGVDERWWDAAAIWHEEPVDLDGVDLARTVPDLPAVRVDLDLLASLLSADTPVAPVVLHSRSPGSRLHRLIAWLQPDLLARLTIEPAASGPRPGHDVVAVLRSGGGRGRRLLAAAGTPPGWTKARGSETVRLERRLRPSTDPARTAVRIARTVADAATAVGWPLEDWFLLRR